MRFIVLTDSHFVSSGQRLYGLDPAEHMRVALEVIARDHTDIDHILITGDLAHHGDAAAYANLKSTLELASSPVQLMMGNHDFRQPFFDTFPDARRDEAGFVQWCYVHDAFTAIALDTLNEEGTKAEPQDHSGRLCEKRLAFLERSLKSAPADRPVIVFQHHPPMELGIKSMDDIMLQDWQAEADIFDRLRKPDLLVMGHVHRPIQGVWRGIPFRLQRAMSHQVAFDLTGRGIPGSHELPDYALFTVANGQITVLERSFMYDGPLYALDSADAAAARTPADLQPA